MSAIIRKERRRIDKRTTLYKRALTIREEVREIHVSLVRKINVYEHDVIRYDLDEEGPHLHLKILSTMSLDAPGAQALVKQYDLLAEKVKVILEGLI